MHQVWRTTEENIKKAQESIIKRVNKHQCSIDWKPGDRVYLLTCNLKSYHPNYKLSNKFDRLYYIVERISFGYWLYLLDSSKIYNIFSLNILKKYPDNSLLGQESTKPPNEAITSKEE